MISIHGVTHAYGTTRVLDEVGLEIPRGRLTSLVGPNGAGKSTLLSVVARLLRPDEGGVLVGDVDVATAPADLVARRLAVLRQDTAVHARLTVVDLVRLGRFPHSKGRLGPECHEAVERALAYVELDALRDRFLDQLSGGQRQRAFIAMVLAQETEYVLLDEPLNNLDMRHAVAMMRLLRAAADDLGRTIVLVLHDINFASVWSDHLVALRDGAVVAQGPPAVMMDSAVLSDVFGLDMRVTEVEGHRIGLYWHPEVTAGATAGRQGR